MCYLLILLLQMNFSLLAQEKDGVVRIKGAGGEKIPGYLLNRVSVNLDTVAFENALAVISAKGNFKLSYNRNRIPADRRVSVALQNVYALEALLYVLEKTNTELLLTKDGQLAVVPVEGKRENTGSITGQVLDADSKEPLWGTNISVLGTDAGTSSGPKGQFEIDRAPVGPQTIQFSYVGFTTKRKTNVMVSENQPVQLVVELEPEAVLLQEIIVTPGQFSVMGQVPTVRQTLTKADLETVPFGEDVYRAMTRLPGVSAGDFSAKFKVRGGENDEILLLLDGMELYEPFHLKDIDGGALSIIDVAAVEGIDLMTGGFPAEFGDRMSGVFNIKSSRVPAGRKRTSLGISFMNARVMSDGTFNNDKGSWLFSARRGYLDLIMELMKEQDPPRPVYYDILSKVDYQLQENHTLSASFLHSGDRLDYVEDDDDVDNTGYSNSYGWLTSKYLLSAKLFVQSLASYGRLAHDREGVGYEGNTGLVDFTVRDHKHVDMVGFKQDWNLDLAGRWFLKWGYDFKNYRADYDYLSTRQNIIWRSQDTYTTTPDTNRANLDPSGRKFGAYFSSRFKIRPPLTAEIGLRYDSHSHTPDRLWSPRINLAYALGKQTFVRAGWGHFYQSQAVHEIRVQDAENQFYPAELAKHWVAGFEHTLRNGLNIRLEGYYKKLSDLRPDYRNLVGQLCPRFCQRGSWQSGISGRRISGWRRISRTI
jgi:hypothetical protein